MAISTIGTDALASAAVTSAKLASGAPSRSQLPAGTVLQVVSTTYNTNVNISTTTLTSTGVSLSITPTSSTSKILAIVTNPMRRGNTTGTFSGMKIALYRGAVNVYTAMSNLGYSYPATNFSESWLVTMSYLDSPATTSSTTYTMYFANQSADGTYMSSCVDGDPATITLMEIAA